MPSRDNVTGRFSVDEGTQARALAGAVRDLTPLLKQAGFYMVAKAQEAFKRQGRSEQWRPRAVPNVAGIVQDLTQGPNVKSRRFDPRPAGIDTGSLRSSITYRIVNGDTVEFGSNLPQADLIQHGGTSEQQITSEVRRNLADYLRANPNEELRRKLAFLFTTDVLVTKVPPRPFVEVLPEDEVALGHLAENYLRRKASSQ
jgi:phage gpG-like protein